MSTLKRFFSTALLATALTFAATRAWGADLELLNVSYDPTRELWRQINEKFIASYSKQTGKTVSIKQSHGGSSAQARAVADGLEADIVSLAMWPDTDAIRKAGLINSGWEDDFPNKSLPYTSTIVFVVRKGNPKGIKDWGDIIKPGVEIVTPNPKTSGNGKLSFLTAWGAVTQRGGSDADATAFITKMYQQAPVLDSGARGAMTTFAQKGIGDVNLAWENEAHLAVAESSGELEIVYPPISIIAEPQVAVVDVNAGRHGTAEVAKAYLDFLYTPEGQDIIATNFYRPTSPEAQRKYADKFPAIQMFPVTAVAKGWTEANDRFFASGGVFDQIYSAGR